MEDSEDNLGGKTYRLGVTDLELERLGAGRGLEKAVHSDNEELAKGQGNTMESTWRPRSDRSRGRGQTKAGD